MRRPAPIRNIYWRPISSANSSVWIFPPALICGTFCTMSSFFFQAEDGIRDTSVTRVQTCALPIFRRWGPKQSQGMSVEFVDANRQLPIAYRNTIANMMAEAEAMNGIFAPDEITYAWYRAKGMEELPYPRLAPGADAAYEIDETLALGDVAPMIAKP